MACFKIYTHIQCTSIQMAAIFYYVTVTPFVMVQFCPTFDIAYYSLDPIVLENTKKRFLAIFWGLVSIM